MATRTTNFGLYKPDPTDDFGDFLPEFNANMDEIDDHLGGGGGSSTLAGLSDVNFSSLTQGDLLIYDGAEWINHSFTEGHTILNESGTAVTARDNLQFTDGLKVTDDSGNNKTKVGVDTAFTEASTRANIASGDSLSTILGKIKKFFTDLKTVAFTGAYSDLSGKPTNVSQFTNDSGYITSSGTAANVSGTVAIANGGTGATTRLDAAKNLTNEEVTAPTHVVGLTNNWGKFGWTTLANLVTALGVVKKSGDTMTGTLTTPRVIATQDGVYAGVVVGSNSEAGRVTFKHGNSTNTSTNLAVESGLTLERDINLPSRSGTLALTSDLGNMINDADHKKERTGAGSITFNSSLKGHLAFVWIKAQANNYWWLGGNAIILGSHPFAYMFITGAGIDAYISLGFGTNPDVTLQWVNQDGNDVTSTSEMVVWVM